jgi:hypothetical protein
MSNTPVVIVHAEVGLTNPTYPGKPSFGANCLELFSEVTGDEYKALLTTVLPDKYVLLRNRVTGTLYVAYSGSNDPFYLYGMRGGERVINKAHIYKSDMPVLAYVLVIDGSALTCDAHITDTLHYIGGFFRDLPDNTQCKCAGVCVFNCTNPFIRQVADMITINAILAECRVPIEKAVKAVYPDTSEHSYRRFLSCLEQCIAEVTPAVLIPTLLATVHQLPRYATKWSSLDQFNSQ